MRFVAGILALAVFAGCSAPAPRTPAETPPGVSRVESAAAAPSWLPAYTPEQLALLKPADHPIQAPAARVLPDLQRFWYANNRKLGSPEDALRFTKLVAKVLNDSPRFYVLDEAAPALANTAVQYGPPAADEPDGFQRA